MEIILGVLLAITFFYFNYKIVKTDIQEKRIPNRYLKYLLTLLPFWYLYAWYFGYFFDVNIWMFFLQIFLSLLIGFLIYHFGKWGAGDAKYLLVLALFIPHIGIIPFIFSIAIITLLYLLGYFLWFWFGPNLWISEHRKTLYKNLWQTKKDEYNNKNQDKTQKQKTLEILKWINLFLIFFICMRLLRIHFISYLMEEYNLSLQDVLQSPYLTYMVLGSIILLVGLGFIIRYISLKIKSYCGEKSSLLFLIIINTVGILFIVYEYLREPSVFVRNISLILTLYLLLYLLIKILLFAYKLVFVANEEEMIHIDNLKKGMIIDKQALTKAFGQQFSLGYCYIKDDDTIRKKQKKKLLYPSPKEYFKNLHSPITKDEKETIQKCYAIINNQNKDNIEKNIKIIQTFSFGLYIFLGFFMSIVFSLIL